MDVPGWRRKGPAERAASEASIDLFWLPLGAGGWFVRLNGRIYEAICALLDARQALDLYHSALEVCLPEGRFVIEVSWPIQDAEGASRGVVLEGPVGSRSLARFRVSRYELRRWRDGVISDADEAVASPQRLTDDPDVARGLLDLVGSVPRLVWGRDETGTGEMWNSNSVISWLIARSGLSTDAIELPAGGRAPGWDAGLVVARLPVVASGFWSLRATRPSQGSSCVVRGMRRPLPAGLPRASRGSRRRSSSPSSRQG